MVRFCKALLLLSDLKTSSAFAIGTVSAYSGSRYNWRSGFAFHPVELLEFLFAVSAEKFPSFLGIL